MSALPRLGSVLACAQSDQYEKMESQLSSERKVNSLIRLAGLIFAALTHRKGDVLKRRVISLKLMLGDQNLYVVHGFEISIHVYIKLCIITRKDMTHSVISIDSIILNRMRNGKNCDFSLAKKWA